MFKWFKKKIDKKPTDTLTTLDREVDIQDAIEESLWEIKDEYDLPTEEVVDVVYSKRRNLDYMREMLLKNK
tara:strand:- start:360 stop:572 length:213 start_codon:yes stop_codon:yes gene_type:complete